MREVETLQARRHEHIVPLLASWNQRSMESEYEVAHLNLLFPYSKCDMEDWLCRSKPPDGWDEKSNILKTFIYDSIMSLCDAVAYLHREINGLISSHHDLKPANILLFEEKTWKIADFGRTHLIRLSAGSETDGASGLGTFAYHPPEYWTHGATRAGIRHGRAFDVWALGCIIVELLTIAVFGWSSQAQFEFRDKRKTNPKPLTYFTDTREGRDNSFHNNSNVVKDWMNHLREVDSNFKLHSILDIADRMLNRDQHVRPMSWEVYLDLYKLLRPRKTKIELEEETRSRVQAPNRHRPKQDDNPLQRAVLKKSMLRIKHLLRAGWSDHPVDINKIDGRASDDIIRMLRVAKVMKGTEQRRRWKVVRGIVTKY